jgi:hypothetical protein
LFWLYSDDTKLVEDEASKGLDAIRPCFWTVEDVNGRYKTAPQRHGTPTVRFRPTIEEAVKKKPKSRCHSFLLLPKDKAE